jgi:prenyltransferase beta subunit
MRVIPGGLEVVGPLSRQHLNAHPPTNQSGIEVLKSHAFLKLGALAKYLLSCCQHPDGGLRDKPPMRSDFYHSLYSLAGLSATQYHYIYDAKASNDYGDKEIAFNWVVDGPVDGEEGDRVAMVHPLFVLPWGDAERIRTWFQVVGKP